jgi:DNA repair photolyase
MIVKEIQVQQILNKITKKDTIFHGNYILDPYQNCSFGCIYCDSTLEDTIFVKINAVNRLQQELPKLKKGRIIIGSVHDPYQPVEQSFQLTHQILENLTKTKFPVHILTKSTSILNDLSLIKQLTQPIITFTILSLDKKIWKTIEPHTPSPLNRLQAMRTLANKGITTGVAIIPTFPFFTEQHIEALIQTAKQYKAKYILHKPLFLQGEQKQVFLKKIKTAYPQLYQKYNKIYEHSPYLSESLENQLTKKIQHKCNQVQLPTTIPIE